MPPGMPDWPSPEGRASEYRGKVLLVDDNLKARQYYADILRALRYEVVLCGSQAEGVRCLEQNVFELVIVSQGSNAFEGRSVLERAVEIDRHLPVLVTARCLNMKCYLDAMQLGAVDCLEEPVRPETLVWVIETHLRRRSVAA